MGRGDKKTAKGKRFQGSFGNSRPANAAKVTKGPKKAEVATVVASEVKAAKKTETKPEPKAAK